MTLYEQLGFDAIQKCPGKLLDGISAFYRLQPAKIFLLGEQSYEVSRLFPTDARLRAHHRSYPHGDASPLRGLAKSCPT
jgi:hypothetical protein